MNACSLNSVYACLMALAVQKDPPSSLNRLVTLGVVALAMCFWPLKKTVETKFYLLRN